MTCTSPAPSWLDSRRQASTSATVTIGLISHPLKCGQSLLLEMQVGEMLNAEMMLSDLISVSVPLYLYLYLYLYLSVSILSLCLLLKKLSVPAFFQL